MSKVAWCVQYTACLFTWKFCSLLKLKLNLCSLYETSMYLTDKFIRKTENRTEYLLHTQLQIILAITITTTSWHSDLSIEKWLWKVKKGDHSDLPSEEVGFYSSMEVILTRLIFFVSISLKLDIKTKKTHPTKNQDILKLHISSTYGTVSTVLQIIFDCFQACCGKDI